MSHSSSTIIQDIKALCDAGQASMAYFYFDFRDINKQHWRDLIPSLLTQLSAQSRPCCDILSRILQEIKKPNKPLAQRVLQSLVAPPGLFVLWSLRRSCSRKCMLRGARLRRPWWLTWFAGEPVQSVTSAHGVSTGSRDHHVTWSCPCCLRSPPSPHAQAAVPYPEFHKPAVPNTRLSRPFPTRIPNLTNGGSTVSTDSLCKKEWDSTVRTDKLRRWWMFCLVNVIGFSLRGHLCVLSI